MVALVVVHAADQGKAVGVMAGGIPQDRFPEFVAWMYPLLGHDDRENMTRIWQMVMPADAFPGAAQLVHKAIGEAPSLAGQLIRVNRA